MELRPLTLGEPVIDALFEQLSSDIGLGQPDTGQPRLVSPPDNLRRLRQELPRGFTARVSAAMRIGLAAYLPNWPLHGWISTWPHFRDIEERCLAAMESRGLVIAHRRRFLGVVPRTSWSALSPEHARESADRIDEAVRRSLGRTGPEGSPGARYIWSPWSGLPALASASTPAASTTPPAAASRRSPTAIRLPPLSASSGRLTSGRGARMTEASIPRTRTSRDCAR
ncbi:hypothetical protein E4K10_28335 [Streptomyces sp. T1317-0309]|nr:hypothetical protein E4K10_28335 [Streptomyces sp. T1317-0309]